MMGAEPVDKWRIETNDRYINIVTSIMSLDTAALILPALFLREFLAVPKETPLMPLLNYVTFIAWGSFGTSILLGLTYSWLSVKWVKLAWGERIWLTENCLEFLLDLTFVAIALTFILGIVASVWFFATVCLAA